MREVTAEDFRVVAGREAQVFDLRVETVAGPCGFAAGAAGALVSGGFGDGFHKEGVEVEAGAELFGFVFAAVDDEADAWDGEGSFGDVGGDYDFSRARRSGVEDALLCGLREGGEEGEDLEFGDGAVFEDAGCVFDAEAFEAFDRFLAGEEDEDVAGEGLVGVDVDYLLERSIEQI